MTNDEMDKVQQVFRQVFKNPQLVLHASHTAADISGWDSLTHMLLIAELEKFFAIRFTFGEVTAFKNVGDMVQLISKKTG